MRRVGACHRSGASPARDADSSRRLRRSAGAACGLLLLAATLANGPALAESEPEPSGWDEWNVSLAVSLKAQQQRAEARITSSLATRQDRATTPPFNFFDVPLDARTHDDYFVPIVPIEMELQTPPIAIPGTEITPRAFFQVSYQFIPITERDFLVDGKFVPLPPDPTAASQGLGGELRIDLQHQWSLSAGVSIPFEVEGIPIAIRPSLDYMGQWLRADATAIGVQIGTDALFRLEAEQTSAVHYLGPRLSIETEAGRTARTRWVFFAEGAIYSSRLSGSQDLEETVVESGETLSFRYEPDALLFQLGAGFRVYWDPRATRSR